MHKKFIEILAFTLFYYVRKYDTVSSGFSNNSNMRDLKETCITVRILYRGN